MALDKNKIIAEATKLVQKGAYEKAIRSYERILAEDPKDVRILLKIGELYQKKGDDRLAADAFKRVAETYADQGFFLKAVAVYKQVVKLDPDDVRVNERLAALYQQLGLMSDAMGQYQLMAAGYEKAGDGARLLDVLKRMVELDPDNIASSIKLGELHQRAGQTGPALEHFRRCAEYLKRHNRADEYLKVAERIAVLAPEDLALTRELAHAYLGRGDTKRALAKLQICFSKDRKDVETLNLLAQAFKELGQGSKQVQVYRELAHAYQEKGRGLDARAVWRKVLELVPDDAEAQQGLQAAAAPLAPAPAPPAQPAPPPRQAATPPPARPAAAPPTARTPARAAPPAPPLEPPPPAPVGGPEQIPKLLTETDVYLKYGLLDKALDHLRKVLAIDPQLPEAHERSRDIHATAGRGQQAVTSAVAAVRAFLERGQQDRAREALARLKQLDPGHPELSGFGTSLGGVTEELHLEGGDVVDVEEVVEIAEEEVVEAPAPTPPAWPTRTPPPRPARFDASSEPSAEMELAEAAHTDADDLALELARQEVAGYGRPTGPGALAGPEPELQGLPPLPDDDDLAAASAAAAYQEGEVIEESIELSVTPGPATSAASLEPEPPTRVTPFEPAAAGPDAGDVDLSDELEEVDFFLQQGLVDEARDALANLRAAHPEHPGVLSRLDAMAMHGAVAPPATAPSGFPAPPPERAPTPAPYAPEPARATPPPAEAAPPAAAAPADLDIGRDLSDELDAAALPALDDEFQYSVEDVFSQFKKGVAETVKAEDSETHYDLGIAYKEMGLLDDAVHEFETAAQGSNRRKEVDCLAMIGVCRLAQDRPVEAIEALRRALRSDYLTREAAKAVHFDLGSAYQAAGDAEVALWCFQKVARLDPAYREVRGRVEALGGGPGRPPPGEPAAHPAQAGAAPSAAAPPPAAKKNVGYL